MRRHIKKIVVGLLMGGLAWLVILGTLIWRYGLHDHATKSDCVIILGAAVQGNRASPVFEERIRHGLRLYDAGYASTLLFTGGVGDGQTHSEASVGRSLAIEHGVPANRILVEEKSRTTQQNLAEASAVMHQHGMQSAIIVSDPLHMKRSMMMADDLGMVAVASPTRSSRYRSLKTKLGFLLRELYFMHHYVVTGQ